MLEHHSRNFRSLTRLSQPRVEPVALMEAKLHLRVDHTHDDGYIVALISAARSWCEDYLEMTFITSQWKMTMDGFPEVISLPRPPCSQVLTDVVITYVPSPSGVSVVLPSSEYRIERLSVPAIIMPNYSQSWPSTLDDINSVSVTWYAGYGDSSLNVPTGIRHAILMLVATWYERRQAVDSVSSSEVTLGARTLLDMNKWGVYR